MGFITSSLTFKVSNPTKLSAGWSQNSRVLIRTLDGVFNHIPNVSSGLANPDRHSSTGRINSPLHYVFRNSLSEMGFITSSLTFKVSNPTKLSAGWSQNSRVLIRTLDGVFNPIPNVLSGACKSRSAC